MMRNAYLSFVLVLAVSVTAHAAIDRGPFLQPTDAMETSIGIVWRSENAAAGTIRYGLADVSENTAATPAGTNHYIKLTGLQPGATYKYRVECDSTTTPEYTFRLSVKTAERRVIVLTDVHAVDAAWVTQQGYWMPDMLAFDPDLIIITGDLVNEGANAAQWDLLFNTYRDLFAGSIVGALQGNHERVNDPSLSLFKSNFYLPENCPGYEEESYYFDYGGVRWTLIGETDVSSWVDGVLSTAFNNNNFSILGKHHPLYLSWEGDDPLDPTDDQMAYDITDNSANDPWKVSLRSVMENNNADILLNGHRHLYHRTFPMLSTLSEPPQGAHPFGTGWGGIDDSDPANYTDPTGIIYVENQSLLYEKTGEIYARPHFATVGHSSGYNGQSWLGYMTIVVNGKLLTCDTYTYSRDGTVKHELLDHFVLDKSGLSSISGTITDGGSPLAGVKVSVDGSHFGYTDANGDYTIPGLADNGYTVTPSKIGYSFSPATTSVTVSGADVTGIGFIASASGGTIILQKGLDGYVDVKDNRLRRSSPTSYYGDDDELRLYAISGVEEYVSVIRFDVSMIGSGSVVSSAVLQLYQHNRSGSGNLYIGTLSADFSEMDSNWNQAGISLPWPGGDVLAGSTQSASIPQQSNGWISFTVTSDVQTWVDGTTNNGFVLWSDADVQDRYWSSDYSIDTALRPKLTITYTTGSNDPAITVTAPAGNDTLTGGAGVTITWSSPNYSDPVKIEFFNGTGWTTLTTNTFDDGAYDWTPPNADLSGCVIRISDAVDGDPTDDSGAFTIQKNNDSDLDGMDDTWEMTHFGDLSHDGTGDGDFDDLTDLDEYLNQTDPVNADTDNDGLNDGEEVHTTGTNPTHADTDSDGLSDGEEVNTVGTDPNNEDTDGDGLLDGVDPNPTISNAKQSTTTTCAITGRRCSDDYPAVVLLALCALVAAVGGARLSGAGAVE